MKEYPSIPTLPTQESGMAHWKRNHNMSEIYAFDKIDGSNIRAEWSSKKGFYKFGSRNRLLGSDQPIINKAEGLIKEQEDIIGNICSKNRWDRVILFYEFAGDKSSFGNHDENDSHNVWLIDANPYKRGILPPKDFVEIFAEANHAALLHRGNCNSDFVQSVRSGTLPNIGSEGVVCKAKDKGNQIVMFKIKRDDWYARLRDHCGGNDKLFNMLK